LLLLLIGQIFLVGAVLQTEDAAYYDVGGENDNIELYDMKGFSEADSGHSLEMLQEDQMPEPDSLEPEDLPAAKAVLTVLDKTAKPDIQNVNFRSEEAFEIVEFYLSKEVKILRRNQGGSLLRIRMLPALAPLRPELESQLQKKLNKFSLHHASSFSEMVFAAGGRIGNPYVASDSRGIFKLCIPYQIEKSSFALKTGEKIAEGLTYYRDRAKVADRCSDVHILRVEPFSDNLSVFPVLANEGIAQKEVLSSMASRYNAVAAVNGAYFTSRGDPIGTLIINRRLISSPLYKRSVFGITEDDTLLFGNPDFSGTLRSGTLSVRINAVNQPRRGDSLVVFTPEYSRSTLTDENGIELVLVKGKIVGIHEKDALIPPDGVIVSAGGDKAAELAGLKLGQSVELDYSIDRPWNTIRHAGCGGPRLVADGKVSINGKEEKFDSSIVHGRHPRTAIALTFDGDLLLVVVDGRSKRSAGMKLDELSDYLKTLGARHAINLDGGGSSSMIVRGKTVNSPSDGCERRISNGILISSR
jgi:hypothetical protein